jgi:peptide/nickel transport system substrate-binding protein
LLTSGLALALLFALACGAAAPPEAADALAAPAAEPAAEKPVEAEKEIPKEITSNLAVTPTPVPVAAAESAEAKVDRVIYALGEVVETNRHWTVSRPSYYQYDPWAETLLDLEATTNNRIPRLAQSWEMTPDAKDWTFHLVEGVPFHDDWGELTAEDVKMSAELHLRDDAGGATPGYFSGLLDSIEVVDPHTITFHMKGSTLLMPDKMSRGFGGGEVLILSKKQIDQEGLEGIDQKPAGTGPYEYGGRTVGQSIWFERIEGEHWRGERPDFKEIEIRWMREEATRLAALLVGEIHIASLSRELQFEAIQQGMKNIGAQVPTNYLVLFLSGQYYSAGDPVYDPSLPWANPQTGKLVRQAMNKAINRDELLQFVLRGSGKPMYNTAFHPSLEGWNPKWVEDWEELYGYDPDKATELMREAGYGPENLMDFTIWNYVSSDEPETRVLVEALINYWEPIDINLKLVDTESGTVQAAYRAKG